MTKRVMSKEDIERTYFTSGKYDPRKSHARSQTIKRFYEPKIVKRNHEHVCWNTDLPLAD